jgi:DNA-binding GntR family transcriptional regulator
VVRRDFDISGTVRERAARELRDRIITGVLPAGARLDLDAITAEFATSRTPVREALLELSFEGLVRVAPRSGVTVIGISPQDVLDSFAILGVLSGQAAQWAAERLDPAGLAELRRLADDVVASSSAAGGDSSIAHPIVEANWRFHRGIHLAARSPRLLTQIRQTVRVVPSNFFDVIPTQESHSLADHEELMAALLDHDGALARTIAERHVLDAGRSLAGWLTRNEPARSAAGA